MSSSESTQEETPDPNEVLYTAVGVEAGLGVVAIILGMLIGPSARALVPQLNQTDWIAVVGGLGLGVVATLPLLGFIAIVRRINHPAIRELESLSDHPMLRTMLRLRPIELLIISLCAGIGEELLFRGWMMPFFAGPEASLVTADADAAVRWYATGGWLGDATVTWSDISWASLKDWLSDHAGSSLGLALIASSIAFGLFHPISKLYVGLTAVMGLYFGILLIVTGNLLVPITAHALYDAIQLWSASAQARDEMVTESPAVAE
ncbi:MAG: CPBP family intramembrane glutamic endopeptidase [Planctomycetota bacterium]